MLVDFLFPFCFLCNIRGSYGKHKSRMAPAINPVAPVKKLESFLRFVYHDIPRNPNVSVSAHNFAKALKLPTPANQSTKAYTIQEVW